MQLNFGTWLFISCCSLIHLSWAEKYWTRFLVKNVSYLGQQHSPGLSGLLGRDGGASVLINNRVVWLFDDTEIGSDSGGVLVSNTAAYSYDPSKNLFELQSFGFRPANGQDSSSLDQKVILSKSLSANGGWIPFETREIAFNQQSPGSKRIAICKSFAR